MGSRETLEQMLSPEQRRLDEIAVRRGRFTNVLLVIIVIILVAGWTWRLIYQLNQPKINEVGISNVQVVGEHMLCPGDILILEYEFHVFGAGKLVEDATVWRDTPPKTIVYSRERSFLIDGTFDEMVTLAWTVPVTYVNPATGNDEPLEPGEYRRIFSVSSISRPSVFAIASVEFVVQENCVAGRPQTGPGEM